MASLFPIDFRSDTVTRPTEGMRNAMFSAKIGDDVYGEDESVNELEAYLAGLFGKEAGLFCPSGTMCNQIAIQLHTRPRDEVILEKNSHVYLYEGGGIAGHSLASTQLLQGDRGRISATQIEAAIRADDLHYPRTSLVVIENTSNKGGGTCYTPQALAEIAELCRTKGLALHLDGARIFNAMAATPLTPAEVGTWFDTISVCLSKGLGAPVGSVLLGSNIAIREARKIRKYMGGGMRQAGFLAAAGLYALQHQTRRLVLDHERAKRIGAWLQAQSWVEEVWPVETNLVIFKPSSQWVDVPRFLNHSKNLGVLGGNFGGGYVRWVTHLDIEDSQEQALYNLDFQRA